VFIITQCEQITLHSNDNKSEQPSPMDQSTMVFFMKLKIL